MFCINCGKEISDESKFCSECGAKNVAQNSGDNGTQGSSVSQSVVQKASWNAMCIVGLALSGVSLLISLYGIVAGAGIVISTLRVMECRRKNKNGRICAILGIVIGVVSVAYAYIMMRI